MAKETTTTDPSISGNLLFYKQPELLNVQTHNKLGITQLTEQPFGFLRETQIIPITVSEFALAALSYPIIFAGEEKTPAIVMGMKQDKNIFVDDEGKLPEGVYVPAFVRRYPFASAKNNADAANMMICIDRASPLICENAESPFFDGDELSPMTNQAIEFVKAYEADAANTGNFCRMLAELDLFDNQDVMVTPPGAPANEQGVQKMGSYMGITDEKIGKLTPEKMIELRDLGALAAIYSHRISQLNWQRVFNMEIAEDLRNQAAGQA